MIDKSLSRLTKQPEHVHAHNHPVEKSKPLITMRTIAADWGARGTKCDKTSVPQQQIIFQMHHVYSNTPLSNLNYLNAT